MPDDANPEQSKKGTVTRREMLAGAGGLGLLAAAGARADADLH
jgi:hypothetical protein